MEQDVGLIGFGEAGATFARAGRWAASARVFDCKTDSAAERAAMLAAYAEAGVSPARFIEDALVSVPIVLSLVTADQVLAVARMAADHIPAGALYCDCNSVAPQTKREAAQMVEAAGAHYVDVAVMAPVNPARMAVPLLLSGGQADAAAGVLAGLGFTHVRVVGDTVGRASAIKMIRSVMVKGLEALTAECVLAAAAAGVLDEVLASLDASERPKPWAERADYNLDRMLVHGLRRAAEMEEVVRTLDDIGTGAEMTRGTVWRQRCIGALGIATPPDGLAAKIGAINDSKTDRKADAA
ncbi:DUF1932 domain-containing protein [Sphingobium sufflavum]|uniref:NAD(P)-dependent oxidoreductase n=1 Tax=Sphingobium sufflavum TaxID=1129547 RepID=UPI001F29C067|nr:NAD(P)-dependent oxidoreductase [Sphingobium sufflavum]MCE7798034.1 DUF1932 domain-containing protein [Sphingobium sufflavum]